MNKSINKVINQYVNQPVNRACLPRHPCYAYHYALTCSVGRLVGVIVNWHTPPFPPPRTSHWRVKTPLTLSERLHFPSLCHRQHRLCFRCLFTPLTTDCIRLCLAIQKPGEVMLLLLHLVVLNFTLRRTFFYVNYQKQFCNSCTW